MENPNSTQQSTDQPKNSYKAIASYIYGLIQRLTDRLEILYEASAFNFYGLILLLLIYLFYWNFPQAKDLLLTLNQEGWGQITMFYASLVTIAAINWYLPRYLYPENAEKLKTWRSFFNEHMNAHVMKERAFDMNNKKAYKKRMIETVPRLIGAFILMVVGLGILNVGNEMDPTKLPWNISAGKVLLILVLFTATLLLVGYSKKPLMFDFSDWLLKGIDKWIYAFLIILLALLIITLFLNKGDFNSLPLLMYSMVGVSFAFLFIVMARRKIRWIQNDELVIKIIFFFAMLGSILFIVVNFYSNLAQSLNPLICANLAFIFYLTLFYALRILGVGLKIYFVFFFLLFLLIAANISTSATHHEISYAKGEQAIFDSEKRKDVRSYFEQWIDQRAPQIEQYLADRNAKDTVNPAYYPIFVVSAEGGGSRAAYWTNIVHHHLNSKIPGYYDQHLFAMTGASGGNTGNSTYFSMKEAGVPADKIHGYAQEMFKSNFLSSSLTLFLGSDFLQSTLGINLGADRAKKLEMEWTKKLAEVTEQQVTSFSNPFLGFWYESGNTQLKDNKTPPLLIINTTHVQSGKHAVISPVRFNPEYYNSLDLIQAVDAMSSSQKTIPLATATLLNASFPYINPAGNISDVGSFVDAGYYDNYGALMGTSLLRRLSSLRDSAEFVNKKHAHLYKQLRFISVLVRNGTVDPSSSPSTATSQILAPVSTIGNIRAGFSKNNLWEMEQAADQFYKIDLPERTQINIIPEGTDESISPIIPLARYLSMDALKAMDAGLQVLESDSQSDLNRLLKAME